MKYCRLMVEVEYDEAKTSPEELAALLDSLIELEFNKTDSILPPGYLIFDGFKSCKIWEEDDDV